MSAAMNELMVELGAMQQRFETIKAERDEWKRLYHALEKSSEADVAKMDAGIVEARAERDTLKARYEKLVGFTSHHTNCDAYYGKHYPAKRCTCGLDELRKQGEA